MAWCGICGAVKTSLVIRGNLNAQRYRHDILRPVVVPFLKQQPRGFIYQDGNARPHTVRLTQNFLANANVQALPWPACSPPIKHLLDLLDRSAPPVNVMDLE